MDVRSFSATRHWRFLGKKPSQRLMGMIMLFTCIVGLCAAAPFLAHPSSAAAAGGIQINAGGPAVAPFVADTDFASGGTSTSANTVSLTGVSNPAPQAVYQSDRV